MAPCSSFDIEMSINEVLIDQVLYKYFIIIIFRILGTENRLMAGSVATVFLSLYVYHVRFLVQGRIDYSYNMKVNVATGTHCQHSQEILDITTC